MTVPHEWPDDWCVYQGFPGARLPRQFSGPPCTGPELENAVLEALCARLGAKDNPVRHVRVLWDCGTINDRGVLYVIAVLQDHSTVVHLVDAELCGELCGRKNNEDRRHVGDIVEHLLSTPEGQAQHLFGLPDPDVEANSEGGPLGRAWRAADET